MVEEQNTYFINRRLEGFINDLPDSSSEVIKKTGIPRTTFYSMLKEGGTIKHENLYAIAKVYDLDLNWLFGIEDKFQVPPRYSENETVVREPGVELSDEQFYSVPFYPQVRASAGGGLIPEEGKPPLMIAFRKYYIANKLRCQASDLVAIKVDGDSMAPTLQDEDVILIDRSKRQPRSGKMLVMRIDETISCKRVQELPGHRYRIMSDNPAYESFEIGAQEKGFDIIGQIVWFARDLV